MVLLFDRSLLFWVVIMAMNDTNSFALPKSKMTTGKNAIAIGSGVSASKDYELVIGGTVRTELRVVMTPEEYVIVHRVLMRAASNGS
jgi:hypothetical protein